LSATITVGQNVRFKTGWLTLLIAAGLMTLNHVVLFFAEDEPVLFAGFAAFTAYALVVIVVPFRQRERWAWFATWMLPIGLAAPWLAAPWLAAPASTDATIAILYYSIAAACVLGLLVTMRDFFALNRKV
jgi:hypothetical protein